MSILLSKIDPSLKLIDEQKFDFFTRITTEGFDNRCVFLIQEKYLGLLDESVRMVITTPKLAERIKDIGVNCGFCISSDPRGEYFNLLNEYEKHEVMFEKSIIMDNTKISSNAVVSDIGVTIGRNVVIEDNVHVYPGTVIEDDVVIQSGAVIGAQLFNTYMYRKKHIQIPQRGAVLIKKDVLVGSNTVIAQAMYLYGKTIIGEGTKIDALVSVSHNDDIGKNCLICAGTVLGGYVKVGENTEIAMGARIKNSVKIGSNNTVGLGSVLLFDTGDGETWFGNPAKRMK